MTRHPDDGEKGRTHHGLTASNPAKTQLITPEANIPEPDPEDPPEQEGEVESEPSPVAPKPDLPPAAPKARPKPAPEPEPEPAPEPDKKANFSDLSLSDLVVEDDSVSQMSTVPRLPREAALAENEEEEEEEEIDEEEEPAEEGAGEEEVEEVEEEEEEAAPESPNLAMPVAVDPMEETPIDEEQVKNWEEVTPVPLDKRNEPVKKPAPEEPAEVAAPAGDEDGEDPDSEAADSGDEGDESDGEKLEGWSSWPGQRPSEVEGNIGVSEEEAAKKKEDARFAPPPEDSLPGLLFPNAARPKPIGNIYSAGEQGARSVPGQQTQDWRGYPSRLIDRFLQSEGRALIFVALGILGLSLAAAGWWLRDPLAEATGLDLEESRVEVTVHTTPRDALLYLDGELVRRANGEPGVLRLAPSSDERFLRVQAQGYPDKRVGFVANQNRVLRIRLVND